MPSAQKSTTNASKLPAVLHFGRAALSAYYVTCGKNQVAHALLPVRFSQFSRTDIALLRKTAQARVLVLLEPPPKRSFPHLVRPALRDYWAASGSSKGCGARRKSVEVLGLQQLLSILAKSACISGISRKWANVSFSIPVAAASCGAQRR